VTLVSLQGLFSSQVAQSPGLDIDPSKMNGETGANQLAQAV